MEFTDVVPLNLGTDVEVDGEVIVKPIIKKDTTIPCKVYKKYHTTEDYQDFFEIKVLQGDSESVEKNHEIATFRVDDVPSGPAGSQKIKLIYNVDKDGILHVTC